jgi:hypothetical protein
MGAAARGPRVKSPRPRDFPWCAGGPFPGLFAPADRRGLGRPEREPTVQLWHRWLSEPLSRDLVLQRPQLLRVWRAPGRGLIEPLVQLGFKGRVFDPGSPVGLARVGRVQLRWQAGSAREPIQRPGPPLHPNGVMTAQRPQGLRGSKQAPSETSVALRVHQARRSRSGGAPDS